ncbi:MAG: hypothetical protein AB7G28_18875 [Pirellulales bacterium]
MNRFVPCLIVLAACLCAAAVAQDPLAPITPSEEPILLLAQKPSRNTTLLTPATPAAEQAKPLLQQSMPTLQLTKPLSWEYKVVQTSGPLQEHELDKLGRDHWELVTVTHSGDGVYIFFFKRVGPAS